MSKITIPSPVSHLEQFFIQVDRDLNTVWRQLELELEHDYPDKANPLKLLKRIKEIQEELPALRHMCEKLLAAKQGLIDTAERMLTGNKASIQRMQKLLNIPMVSTSDDTVYISFQKIIDEWNKQLGLKGNHMVDEGTAFVINGVNQTLFSSKVNGN